MTRKYNNELVENLSVQYPKRSEPNYAWGNALSGMLMTPKLRGLWPGSTVNNVGDCFDISGQGRTLSAGILPTYAGASLYPYADFTATSGMYLNRNTEAGLEITDALSVWTWVYFDTQCTNSEIPLIGKWGYPGNRSWILRKNAANQLIFTVSTDGTSELSVNDNGEYYEAEKWIFIVGSFAPLTEIDLFVGKAYNGSCRWYVNTTGIVPNIFNSSAPLQVGGITAINQYFDGKLSLWGLANYA